MEAVHLFSLIKSPDHGSGSGSALHPAILITSGIAALVATVLATFSIWLQLKNYRRPILQRYVYDVLGGVAAAITLTLYILQTSHPYHAHGEYFDLILTRLFTLRRFLSTQSRHSSPSSPLKPLSSSTHFETFTKVSSSIVSFICYSIIWAESALSSSSSTVVLPSITYFLSPSSRRK